MRFALDPSFPFTAREQIREQLINMVHLGVLSSGDRLPTVRDLAEQLGVNLKTAFGVYRHLAREGMVEIHPQSGVFVKFSGVDADRSYADNVRRFVKRVALRAEQFNLTPRRLARLLQAGGSNGGRLRCAVLECNQEQVDLFSEELERELNVEAIRVVLGRDEAAVLRSLRHADLLVTTDFHWDAVRRLAARSHREAARIRLNPAFLRMLIANARRGLFPMVVTETSYESRFRSALALLAPPHVAQRIVLIDWRDRKRLKELWPKVERVYVSPLCYDQVCAQVPKQVKVLTMRDMISRQSLQELRRKLA
ncbi:MAG: GntR family transcriptional regulator [Acidobacteriota bacterium]|nr:GntR family transcriptional regulator [Acidobacteriota bacterium]